jgi:energy-coupling factor transporter ATP-binding protein EcfA2
MAENKSNGKALIKLEGVKKVFYTEEVETHALSDIHLEIKEGEYVAIAGPAAARPRCSRSSGCSTRPPAASTCWMPSR